MSSTRNAHPRSRQFIQATGFWTAVILPFVYLPLPALAPEAPWLVPVLVTAVLGNFLALAVGHGYRQSDGPIDRSGTPAD